MRHVCELCRRSRLASKLVSPDDGATWYCADFPSCNYHTRLRLRIPQADAYQLLLEERARGRRRPGVIQAA